MIFNKRLVSNFKKRHIYNVQNGNYESFLLNYIYEDVYDKITLLNRNFNNIFEINIKSDFLLKKFESKNFFQSNTENYFFGKGIHVINDIESMCFNNKSFDLIISLCDFHQVNDVLGSLFQIKNLLKKSAIFISAIPVAGTLSELRHSLIIAEDELKANIYPHIFPFIKEEDLVKIMQKVGFHNIVLDILSLTISYESVHSLITDIRRMGQSNSMISRSRKFLGKNILSTLENIYKNLYKTANNEINASFNIATIIAFN